MVKEIFLNCWNILRVPLPLRDVSQSDGLKSMGIGQSAAKLLNREERSTTNRLPRCRAKWLEIGSFLLVKEEEDIVSSAVKAAAARNGAGQSTILAEDHERRLLSYCRTSRDACGCRR